MNAHRLFRSSGLALIGAGVSIALGMGLHPNLNDPHAAMLALWSPSHMLLLVGLLLALFGVIGLFLRHAERLGWLGFAGFAVLEIGVVLTIVAIVVDAFVFPAIDATAGAAALLDSAGPLLNGPLGLLLLGATVTYILGTLLFGAAMLRSGALPRIAVVLLLVGGTLVAMDPFIPQLVAKLSAVALGTGFVWLGIHLFGRQQAALSPQQALLQS